MHLAMLIASKDPQARSVTPDASHLAAFCQAAAANVAAGHAVPAPAASRQARSRLLPLALGSSRMFGTLEAADYVCV